MDSFGFLVYPRPGRGLPEAREGSTRGQGGVYLRPGGVYPRPGRGLPEAGGGGGLPEARGVYPRPGGVYPRPGRGLPEAREGST